MRLPSGTTDQYIYFYAVDSTDFTTPETGLSSFTVYRSRNGGAAAAMTTPTINETDGTNMPGVYELLLDEDMTIDSGDDSQEMVFHIAHAGMAPVTRTIEIYRPKITIGETSTAQTGDNFARLGAPAGASVSADIAAIEAQTGDIGAAGAGLTAVPWNASWDAEVQSEVADALTAYDPPTKAELDSAVSPLATSSALSTVAGYLDTEIASILADTNELQADWANGGRLDLILDARASQSSVDTIDGIVDSILVDTAEIGAAGAGLTALASAANLATVDSTVDAILVDTDTTIPSLIAALNDLAASDILTTALTESYAADGAAPTLSQAIFLIQQFLYERATVGTTVTVKKLDGSATAATLTLDSGTTPTSITRST